MFRDRRRLTYLIVRTPQPQHRLVFARYVPYMIALGHLLKMLATFGTAEKVFDVAMHRVQHLHGVVVVLALEMLHCQVVEE